MSQTVFDASTTKGAALTGINANFTELYATDATLAAAIAGKQATMTTTATGLNFLALTNPGAITFIRINADNSVSSLSASDFRTAIGAGTSSFSGAYADLSGKPTLFDGAYSSLTGAPTAFDPANPGPIGATPSTVKATRVTTPDIYLGAGDATTFRRADDYPLISVSDSQGFVLRMGMSFPGNYQIDLSQTTTLMPSGTPASAGAAGTAGEFRRDASFIYICTATNTWARAAIASW